MSMPVSMDCFVYSPGMRVAYVIGVCLAVGLLVPWIINQQFQFTPESHDVPGTCHIMMGLRMNSLCTKTIHFQLRKWMETTHHVIQKIMLITVST